MAPNCTNADCHVAETGVCVEGLEPPACVHYSENSAVRPELTKANENRPPNARAVDLPSAEALSLLEGSLLLRRSDARVLAIVGPRDAGKTSLIASLYELLQEGPVSNMHYAESRTLHAFERACHDSRSVSRRRTPEMYRTPRGKVQFYHLDLAAGSTGEALALLLADRAGEEYEAAAVDASIAKTFPEIERADSLTVLVDGQRLSDSSSRHNLKSDILMMLQGLVEGGAISVDQRLALVLTKIDLLMPRDGHEKVYRDFTSLSEDVQRVFRHRFLDVTPFETAAAPLNHSVPRGQGVPGLLQFWVQSRIPTTIPKVARPSPHRAFGRLSALTEGDADA